MAWQNNHTPMTEAEAREVVARMNAETNKNARVRVMQLALRMGNLSDGAKAVYRDALASDGATT